jgi:hypothetical protein
MAHKQGTEQWLRMMGDVDASALSDRDIISAIARLEEIGLEYLGDPQHRTYRSCEEQIDKRMASGRGFSI